MIRPIDDEERAELLGIMQQMTGVGDGYVPPRGKRTVGQLVVALNARLEAAEVVVQQARLFEGLDVMHHPLCNSDLIGLVEALAGYDEAIGKGGAPIEREEEQHARQEATWRDECMRLRAELARLQAERA